MALQRSQKKSPRPRKRKCKVCGERFEPFNSMQPVCATAKCALEWSRISREKAFRKEQAEARRRLKTRRDWLRDAQNAFNAYIRARDVARPCVSCGRFHDGQWHAGHYRPGGNCSALRFDEDNVHKQCQPCNTHKSGDLVNYRLGLLERVGPETVDRLERDHPPKRWTKEELQAITVMYKDKLRELKNGSNN